METSDLEGKNRRTVAYTPGTRPTAITVYGDTVYWLDTANGDLNSVLADGGDVRTIIQANDHVAKFVDLDVFEVCYIWTSE